MEKVNTIGNSKKKPEESNAVEKEGAGSSEVENKKDQTAEKLSTEKEGTPKNEGNQKKERIASSTPKTTLRSTRSSNNPDFVAKQRHFLQKVNQGAFYQSSEEEGDSIVANGSQNIINKRKRSVSGGPVNVEALGSTAKTTPNVESGTNNCHTPSPSLSGSKPAAMPKKRKSEIEGLTRDIYCWVCHREMGTTSGGTTLSCEVCPRVYHARCCHNLDSSSPHPSSPSLTNMQNPRKGWACPECVKIVRAETLGTRSRAMQLISMDQLCTLLKYVLARVRTVTGAEPFFGPVDLQQFPRYREYVASPMDLGLIERNIRRRTYGSTEAFLADMKWIVHNSIIFNTQHSKLTSIARSIIKNCRQELMEIENCPDCYNNAHTVKDNWFIEVCRRPHILVWAKLKGFPHWPAKAMRVNNEGCVDVRFFGAHDRAWVPAKDCFLYSEEMPLPPKNRKKNNLDGCIMEVEEHIKKLKDKFGVFVYAPFRTVFDPAQEDQMIMKMLPKYHPLVLENVKIQQGKNNIAEGQISRESPAISAGTEEESEEDQSHDEDDVTRKRVFESTFEDSMEVLSACEAIQSSEAAVADKTKESAVKEETMREHENDKVDKTKKLLEKISNEEEKDKNKKAQDKGESELKDKATVTEKEDVEESKEDDTEEKKEKEGMEVDKNCKEEKERVEMADKKEIDEDSCEGKGEKLKSEGEKIEEHKEKEKDEEDNDLKVERVETDKDKTVQVDREEDREEDSEDMDTNGDVVSKDEKKEQQVEDESEVSSTQDDCKGEKKISPSPDSQKSVPADDLVKLDGKEKYSKEMDEPAQSKNMEEGSGTDDESLKEESDMSEVWDDMPIDDDASLSAGIDKDDVSKALSNSLVSLELSGVLKDNRLVDKDDKERNMKRKADVELDESIVSSSDEVVSEEKSGSSSKIAKVEKTKILNEDEEIETDEEEEAKEKVTKEKQIEEEDSEVKEIEEKECEKKQSLGKEAEVNENESENSESEEEEVEEKAREGKEMGEEEVEKEEVLEGKKIKEKVVEEEEEEEKVEEEGEKEEKEVEEKEVEEKEVEEKEVEEKEVEEKEVEGKEVEEKKLEEVDEKKIEEKEIEDKESEVEESEDNESEDNENEDSEIEENKGLQEDSKDKEGKEIAKKGDENKDPDKCMNNFNSSEIHEKIDVNKLRESLMTKCANVVITNSEVNNIPELTPLKSDLLPVNALHPETGALMQVVDDAGEKSITDDEVTNLDQETEDDHMETHGKAANLVPSPASNKGDVGSQLSILGKLQQRLSFANEDESDEEVAEKEDEMVVEELESVVGDASSSSTENEEEDEVGGREVVDGTGKPVLKKGKVVVKKNDSKASKKDEKKPKDAVLLKDDGGLPKEDGKVLNKAEEVKESEKDTEEAETMAVENEAEKESEIDDKQDEEINNEEAPKEKIDEKEEESELKDDAGTDQKSLSKHIEKEMEKEISSTSDAGNETNVEKEEVVIKDKILDRSGEDSNSGTKAVVTKIKLSEMKSTDSDNPPSPMKPKFLDVKDSDSNEPILLKTRSSLMKVKSEEVLEEEVLNREVLKESNMVVVQKTVKTRKFDDDAPITVAPKRARKGVAQKALIVDRSESPGQDEVFPSMFLDPSVTITVLQESEKENGDMKEQVSTPPSVEELRTSVNLSNDVSLTMVRPSVALEGLAAAQDCALSRTNEQNQVDIVGVLPQNSTGTAVQQFRPRARKSFPRPLSRINTRSPQALMQGPTSMEVKRITSTSREVGAVNLSAGPSQGRSLPSSSVSSSTTLALRAVTSQPQLPITSHAFSSAATFSTASASQPLVHSMVSQVLPCTSALVVTTQSSSASTSRPHIHPPPRPPTFPLSGPQPIFGPPEAGPLSADFSKHSHKLANYMRVTIEEILGDLSRMGNQEAAIKLLRLELEKLRWEHQNEIAELKHNQDLMVLEMRSAMEKDKMRCLSEIRRHCESEKLRAIEETKRKQWCANCSKEALFYCCWNTSYCDYPCQQAHWPRHMSSCAQNNGIAESGDGDTGSNGIRKDGSSSGHKGMPVAAPSLPFHQFHRPGFATHESLPEEEYYDEDSNSPSTPRMGTSGGTYRVKRRRCGLCKGCLVKNNCGNCAPCRNSKTHQVCRMRRCRSLQSDWVPTSASVRRTPSRPISPEPAPLTVSLKTPPLTYASKRRRGSRSPRASSTTGALAIEMAPSTNYSMPHQQNGGSLDHQIATCLTVVNDTQTIHCSGNQISRQPRPSQSQQQAPPMELQSPPIGHPMIHPHLLSQAMTTCAFPALTYSQPVPDPQTSTSSTELVPAHSQQSHNQPSSSRSQQPPYAHPKDIHPYLQQPPFPIPPPQSHTQQSNSHQQPSTSHNHQSNHQPSQHNPSFPQLPCSQNNQQINPVPQPSHSQFPPPPPLPCIQNGQPPRFQNPNHLPGPAPKNSNSQYSNSASQNSFMQNPFLFPPFPQNSHNQQHYAHGSSQAQSRGSNKSRSRNHSSSRSRSSPAPIPNNIPNGQHIPCSQPSILNPPFAILSSTSILMPRSPNNQALTPHDILFPNTCHEMTPATMAQQHQIHRQRMAAGMDIFTESLRFAARPSYFV